MICETPSTLKFEDSDPVDTFYSSQGTSCLPPIAKLFQLCPTLWNAMDCIQAVSSVHGFSGKHTGVSCHVLLQGIFLTQGLNPHLLCLALASRFFTLVPRRKPLSSSASEVAQSCPTLCNPMNCSLSGSSIHGIFQARVLEWVAISFSRGSSRPRDRTQVSRIAGRRFTIWATREAPFPLTGNIFSSSLS